MSIELDVTGLSETIASLERKKAAIPRAMLMAAHDVAENIAASTQDYAPVKTGTLRDSVHVEDVSDGSLVIVDPKNKQGAGYAPFVEYGTEKMTGRAFLGRAVAKHADELADDFWKAMG